MIGCDTPRSRSALDEAPGKLRVQLQLREKDQIQLEKAATVYADGTKIGFCDSPGEVVAELPAGPHKISIEIPWAWQSTGDQRHRSITLTGEQTVEIVGRGKSQALLFTNENLKKKSLPD